MMQRNPGHLPADAVGKRVPVPLRNGHEGKGSWPADGAQGCCWRRRGHPFDIQFYEVVK